MEPAELQRLTKLRRWNQRAKKQAADTYFAPGSESTNRFYRPGLRRRCELTTPDFLDIISHWQAHSPTMAELGSKFRVSRVLAQKIIYDYKANPGFLLKLRAKEQVYEERVDKVRETVVCEPVRAEEAGLVCQAGEVGGQPLRQWDYTHAPSDPGSQGPVRHELPQDHPHRLPGQQ